jgi:hypothetical protein
VVVSTVYFQVAEAEEGVALPFQALEAAVGVEEEA